MGGVVQSAAEKIDYLNPEIVAGLDAIDIPLVRATDENIKDFGCLVDHPDDQPIEIVQWPQQGWRPVDAGTGDEGGTVEGDFFFWWENGVLSARNEAVNDAYVMGWDHDPSMGRNEAALGKNRRHVYLWHANYHPDGGQMFFPKQNRPFVAPLALPGDDIKPTDFIGFYFDGSQGLYIHPGVWHETLVPLDEEQSFLDRQGRVHARVSCFMAREFNAYLRVPLEL